MRSSNDTMETFGLKVNLALVASIIIAVGLVALIFTAIQISKERQKLNIELATKTSRVAEDFYNTYLEGLENENSHGLKKITDSIISQYSFTGIAIYYNTDSIIPVGSLTKEYPELSANFIARAIAADSSMGNNIKINGKRIYEYIRVVKRQDLP